MCSNIISKTIQLVLGAAFLALTCTANAQVFISEIHYDNAGADEGEAVEISGDITADLSGWSLVFYNGAATQLAPYGEIDLTGAELTAVDGCGDTGFYVANFTGIQNGSPDGIALVDNSGMVRQFLSYEGSFIASTGPAAGMLSDDIGVAEESTTPVGLSLQLLDGVWLPPAESNFGSCIGGEAPTSPPQFSKIHTIQGTGPAVTSEAVFTVEAIVIGNFQRIDQLSGFFIQEEDADADSLATTSEGIFVYCGDCPTDVNVGDKVTVTGTAGEYGGMSQLTARNADDIQIISTGHPLPSAALVNLPIATNATTLAQANSDSDNYFEAFEGMLVTVAGELTVTEYFELSRYGQIELAAGGRLRQFTDVAYPSTEGWLAHQIDLATRRLILDDDSGSQNNALINNSALFHPQPGFSTTHFFRGGDTISNLTGPLQFAFSEWRIRPVVEAFDYTFIPANPRTNSPEKVGGTLKVASFNVLNYFTSIDLGVPTCGPDGTMDCRGADSAVELERQTAKIVAALCAMDADIVGLMELENPTLDASVTPIETLVAAINNNCGRYAALKTGTVGTDAITVGLIYRPAVVKPVGRTAILDSLEFVDPLQSGEGKNRPVIAQSFSERRSGKQLTIAVNHLKSKGSSCGGEDDDTTTGQGNCNGTRKAAAQREIAWLATYPTGVRTDNILVIGDLNSYRNEDPITAFITAGFTDAIDLFRGPEAYSYVFDGQLGYLDHALVSESLLPYITDVTDWHINADEVNVLDYDDTVVDPSEQSYDAKPTALPLFTADPFRASDHDPLIIGIHLGDARCHGKHKHLHGAVGVNK